MDHSFVIGRYYNGLSVVERLHKFRSIFDLKGQKLKNIDRQIIGTLVYDFP